MLWTEFTALLLLATAMSFTPGPNTALATAMAANAGLRHSLRFVLAVPVGWCLLLLLRSGQPSWGCRPTAFWKALRAIWMPTANAASSMAGAIEGYLGSSKTNEVLRPHAARG